MLKYYTRQYKCELTNHAMMNNKTTWINNKKEENLSLRFSNPSFPISQHKYKSNLPANKINKKLVNLSIKIIKSSTSQFNK